MIIMLNVFCLSEIPNKKILEIIKNYQYMVYDLHEDLSYEKAEEFGLCEPTIETSLKNVYNYKPEKDATIIVITDEFEKNLGTFCGYEEIKEKMFKRIKELKSEGYVC